MLDGSNREKDTQIVTPHGNRHEAIAEAIERYSRRHPEAADSVRGIAEWWLAEEGVRAAVEDVREALRLLESRGVMEPVTLQDGRQVWRSTRSSPDV